MLTSPIQFMSIKRFLSTSWYIGGCYLFLLYNCRSIHRIETIVRAFFFSAVIIAVYSLGKHSVSGFSDATANDSMRPFFQEHGSYSAHLSIVLGLAIGLSFGTGGRFWLRRFAVFVSIILFVGIILSYTRAAYLGLGAMMLFFLVIKSKELFTFRSFLGISIIAIILTLFMINLGVQTTMQKTTVSIADVERNLSNLERFNRWMAALHMIQAHPILGVGYGTYPIMYEKYKDVRYLTPISDFVGWAHNDYLTYCAEAGVFALLSWLFFLFTTFRLGIINYFRTQDEFLRNLILGCLGGLLTYVVHAMFNDFLQLDKVAVPFWVAIGLVALTIELLHKQNNKSGIAGEYLVSKK